MVTQIQPTGAYTPGLVAFDTINQLAQQIAASFDPERIYLFGSYAYGQPTPDSDVDIMVVMDTDDMSHRPARSALHCAAISRWIC